MTRENRTLSVVFFTILMDLIGFGIIIPISPFFAESLGATPAAITLLGAGYSLMQFLFAPFWGRLSDRVGRRPVILSSIVIATVGYVLFAYSESFAMLFLARILSGFGTANFGAAQAIIADSTPPEHRAKGMGILGAAFGLGFTLGPAVGGILGQWGMRVPILTAATLSALNFCLAYLLLPETRAASGVVVPSEVRSPLRQILALAREANLRRLLVLLFVYSTAFSMMEQVMALFVEWTWVGAPVSHPTESAGRASMMTAWAMIVVGITAIIVQGGLIGKLVKRYGEKSLLIAGCVMVGIAFLAIPFCGYTGYGSFLGVMVLLAGGSGILTPSASSLLSRATAADEQGHIMGVGQSLSALGRVFGPAVAGLLFEQGIGLPFVVGGVMILACAFLGRDFQAVDRH
ncbi:MFS transporter [bacterium]|nr:MFS transporter [bacterium]